MAIGRVGRLNQPFSDGEPAITSTIVLLPKCARLIEAIVITRQSSSTPDAS
ncbi:unnamed protein product [Fusarium graminearum]|uniref:Chromosome 2, complete genome n=1 Tax=Gibberella zeae (strain ATCC MYA-4620 / CBS 123657 / FGSC 9075 / NRRL 31084 / PH-1) TaxID=229533 RepID=A0A098DD77_GIBZE|nr:unnamed protein product [Fusarium graminearum]CZS79681.1 unnamed protein product [Fusarium graminearum]